MTLERVYVNERVLSSLRQSAEQARPLETGGILVGVLRDGEPWITSAVEVIDFGRTSTRFVIPFGATPMAVEAEMERDGRVGYIGMWHSHPANLAASPTDKATLRRDARRRTRPKKVPAILFVVRDTDVGWCVDALRDRGSGPAPVEIVLTGPMGREDVIDAR
jgi:Prokaryotic homologs of the JAB domain